MKARAPCAVLFAIKYKGEKSYKGDEKWILG
jgi:hypothetical protein